MKDKMRRNKNSGKETWIQIMMAVFIMLVGVLYSSSNCYAAEKTEITVNSFYQLK